MSTTPKRRPAKTPKAATKTATKSTGKSTSDAKSKSRERSGQVQSLARALSILNTLAESAGGMTLTDLAHTIGLAPSTAHRLLTTLQQERFVRFEPVGGVWQIGVQAFIVGSGFLRARDLVATARPYMQRLMEESGETVNLAVEDRGLVVYLAQVECQEMMRAFARPGARVPMHSSGVGKALMSSMPASKVEKIIDRRGMDKKTDKTIDSLPELLTHVADIRRRGYSIDDEEQAIGLRCVASVIHDEFGEPCGALSLSGPMARLVDNRIAELGSLVAKTAAEITAEWGGRKD